MKRTNCICCQTSSCKITNTDNIYSCNGNITIDDTINLNNHILLDENLFGLLLTPGTTGVNLAFYNSGTQQYESYPGAFAELISYFHFPESQSFGGWIPEYNHVNSSGSYRLRIPVTGIYSMNFMMNYSNSVYRNGYPFISVNSGIGTTQDVDPSNNIAKAVFLANQSPVGGGYQYASIGAIVILKQNDYINFGNNGIVTVATPQPTPSRYQISTNKQTLARSQFQIFLLKRL
jgi:hypothetical protein